MYVHSGSHAAAASDLGISIHTVQAHLGALRSRLGVHNEAQVIYVMWLGFRDHLGACEQRDHDGCLPWGPLLRGAGGDTQWVPITGLGFTRVNGGPRQMD
jgi:hypothetical protein